MTPLRTLPLVLVLAACGPASVSGSIAGQSVDSSDAIGSLSLGNRVMSVVIGGNTSDLCADLAGKIARKDAGYLTLDIAQLDPIQPGTYVVGGGNAIVGADSSHNDTGCGKILQKSASSGTITIDKLDGPTINGSFMLQFGADKVDGSFQAKLCSTTSLDTKTCQ